MDTSHGHKSTRAHVETHNRGGPCFARRTLQLFVPALPSLLTKLVCCRLRLLLLLLLLLLRMLLLLIYSCSCSCPCPCPCPCSNYKPPQAY